MQKVNDSLAYYVRRNAHGSKNIPVLNRGFACTDWIDLSIDAWPILTNGE